MVPAKCGLRTAVWVGLLALGAGDLGVLGAAEPAVPAAKAGVGAAKPDKPAANAAKGPRGAAARDVFLPPDRNSLLLLSRARQLNQEGRYAEAVRCLGTILEASEDYFVGVEKDSPVFSGLKAEARALLGQMPRQGRESYELQYGARARQMLAQAVEAGDAARLAEVSRRFFHTRAGYEATLLLAMDYLDRGSPLAAALMLKRLKENSPLVDQFEPGLSVVMAACLLRGGEPEKARVVLDEVRKRFPQAKVRIAGTEVALSAEPAALLGSPQANGGKSREREGWLMVRGSAERNAATAGSGPLLSLCWRVPTADLPFVETLLEQIQQSFHEQDRWSPPAGHPVVVDDVVLMRTARNLLAVDFVTGKRLWEVPGDDPFESLLDPPQDAPFGVPPQIDVTTGLRYRMWGDATFGTLSSDAQRVFAVEDLSLDVGMWAARQMFFINRRSNPTDPKPFNRLAAYDLRTGKLAWHVGGSAEELGLPLAGMFFLGPPLPLGGQLYVLGEQKGEIRLAVLDAKTGNVVWTQHLAVVDGEDDILQDPVRRHAGVSPSYADGVLACPTSNKSIVALDLANRSLLWGYDYSARDSSQAGQPGGFFAMPPRDDPELGARWAPSNLVIAQGRVLATPADSGEIHCLNLLDGKLLWTKPRQDDCYLACVHRGNVMLVGRRGVRALRLDNGGPAWDNGSVVLAGGGAVSGTGYFNGELYFVPLDTAEVVSIDPASGAVVHRYKSRRGFVPGNLVCHRGRIISQRAAAVDAFYQLDELRKQVEARLAANPGDPEALAQRGEILWDEGKLAEAVACFRRAFELAPSPNARNLLRDALLEGLKTEFAVYRRSNDQIERLLDDSRQRAAYLRLMAAGCEKLGEYRVALDHYVRLIDLDQQQREIESLDRWHAVRRDRWIREQLATLRQAVPPDVRAEIDKLAEARLDAAAKSGTAEALQRCLDYFGGLPPADAARGILAARLRQGGKLLQAEFALRRMERSADRGRAGAALAELASLLGAAKLAEDAAVCYVRLGREFADVACREGKTGRQLLEALAADDAVGRLLRPAPPWPAASVSMHRASQRSVAPTPYGSTAIQFLGEGSPFFADFNLDVQHSPAVLTARDGWGKTRWQANVSELMRQGIPPMTPAFWRAAVRDHLLLIVMGTRILAIDALVPEGGAPRVLWSQDLDDPGRLPSGRRSMRFLPVGFNPAMRGGFTQYGVSGFPANVPSAITEQAICYQRFQRVLAVDPLSGEVLWTRDDARPDSAIFGDDQMIFVVPPDNAPAMVLRAADGKLLGTRPVPAERLAPVGRHVLVWRNVDNAMLLELLDLWEKRPVWQAEKFALDARVSVFDGGLVGVFEPRGRFVLLASADGRKIVDAGLQPQRVVSEMYLVRAPENYILVLNGLERTGTTRPQFYGLHGVLVRNVTRAHVWGFDREGKKLWPEPVTVEDQFFIANQPPRLPMLMFACGFQEQRAVLTSQPKLALLGVDKRTGKVFRPAESFEGLGYFRLAGDPDKKAIQVQLQRDVVTLNFSDRPPPPPKSGDAVLKSILKALEIIADLPSGEQRRAPGGPAAVIGKSAKPAPKPAKPAGGPGKPAPQPPKPANAAAPATQPSKLAPEPEAKPDRSKPQAEDAKR